jgi:gliding motility-associated-like protein
VQIDMLGKEVTLYVPNAFTPDENNLNDEFKPEGIIMPPFEYVLNVYDKWGQNVFHSDELKTGWDGSFKGVQLPPDVYTWTINVKADCYVNSDYRLSGNLTLIK